MQFSLNRFDGDIALFGFGMIPFCLRLACGNVTRYVNSNPLVLKP